MKSSIDLPDKDIMERADERLRRIKQTRTSIIGLVFGVIAGEPVAIEILQTLTALSKATEQAKK